MLTCAHVVGSEPRPVMARFSFAGGEPISARVAGWLPAERGDLALLELERDPPPAGEPAPLRPAPAVTGHACAAYGYPRGLEGGVWSGPEIAGQTADPDRLQLTAQVAHGHQIEKGFSGTGLFDTEIGAVVGLVVTREKGVLGGFAIPMRVVVAAFPQLRPWVGWRLGTDRFLRQHWRPRARGVYEDTTSRLVLHRPDRDAAGANRVA